MKRMIAASIFCLATFSTAIGAGWDGDQIGASILEELNAGGSSLECKNNCNHTILGEYHVELATGKHVVVVSTSIEPNSECHACAPELSFFVYQQSQDQWHRQSTHLSYISWGAWGAIGKEDVIVQKLSPNNLGLFLEGGYTAQGYFAGVHKILLLEGKSFNDVLTICSAANNAGAVGDASPDLEDWNASFQILPNGAEMANLLVTVIDNVKGKFTKSEFSFSGQTYKILVEDERLTGACS